MCVCVCTPNPQVVIRCRPTAEWRRLGKLVEAKQRLRTKADISDWTCMHVQQMDAPAVAATFESPGTPFDHDLQTQVQPVSIELFHL